MSGVLTQAGHAQDRSNNPVVLRRDARYDFVEVRIEQADHRKWKRSGSSLSEARADLVIPVSDLDRVNSKLEKLTLTRTRTRPILATIPTRADVQIYIVLRRAPAYVLCDCVLHTTKKASSASTSLVQGRKGESADVLSHRVGENINLSIDSCFLRVAWPFSAIQKTSVSSNHDLIFQLLLAQILVCFQICSSWF